MKTNNLKQKSYYEDPNSHPANIWSFLFSRHRDLLFRKLRRTIIALIIYSIIAILIQRYFDKLMDKMLISNLGQFHLIFSFVISILIAFRVNSSYARWWEGRGYWGSLVNNSRNLAMKFNNFIGLTNDSLFTECLKKLPKLLKFHLRGQIDECQVIANNLGIKCTVDDHFPTLLINQMYRRLNHYRKSRQITLEQYLVMDSHLANITDVVGGCEKIVSTPIPTPFKLFVNQALYFYMIIFPFGWAETFGILIVPIIIVFVYILQGMEILAEDLENPFEENYAGYTNNLHLDAISTKIEQNIDYIAQQEV